MISNVLIWSIRMLIAVSGTSTAIMRRLNRGLHQRQAHDSPPSNYRGLAPLAPRERLASSPLLDHRNAQPLEVQNTASSEASAEEEAAVPVAAVAPWARRF